MGSGRQILVCWGGAAVTYQPRQNRRDPRSPRRDATQLASFGNPRVGRCSRIAGRASYRRMGNFARTRSFRFRLSENHDAPESVPHSSAVIEESERRDCAVSETRWSLRPSRRRKFLFIKLLAIEDYQRRHKDLMDLIPSCIQRMIRRRPSWTIKSRCRIRA
jgi:hypothetical protein